MALILKKTITKLVFIIAFTFTFTFTFAQRDYNVKNSQWTEVNIIGTIGKKKRFEYQLDWQYRRQSEQQNYQANPNLGNIFLNPYQNVFRPWIHFFPEASRKIRFSVSPIGFWATFGPAGSNGTVKASGEPSNDKILEYPEIRSCYQITSFDKIGRVKLQYRARFEFRWVGIGQPSSGVNNNGSGFDFGHGFPMTNSVNKYRLRLFSRADIALKGQTIDEKEFYIAVADELWVGMGAKTANANFLDQNRAYAGVGYKVKSDIRVELGYLNQIVPQSISGNLRHMDFNNVLHCFIIFDNFNRFFEKKKLDPNPNPGSEGF